MAGSKKMESLSSGCFSAPLLGVLGRSGDRACSWSTKQQPLARNFVGSAARWPLTMPTLARCQSGSSTVCGSTWQWQTQDVSARNSREVSPLRPYLAERNLEASPRRSSWKSSQAACVKEMNCLIVPALACRASVLATKTRSGQGAAAWPSSRHSPEAASRRAGRLSQTVAQVRPLVMASDARCMERKCLLGQCQATVQSG
mmetsp:Transcript_2128/g.6406  ORF Transcript_2128/g.6406 Transcript_2128/m.6406 type:complete len:201 (+) Transcript_2128:308-910(+)